MFLAEQSIYINDLLSSIIEHQFTVNKPGPVGLVLPVTSCAAVRTEFVAPAKKVVELLMEGLDAGRSSKGLTAPTEPCQQLALGAWVTQGILC